MRYCKCGCKKELPPPNAVGRPRVYFPGHQAVRHGKDKSTMTRRKWAREGRCRQCGQTRDSELSLCAVCRQKQKDYKTGLRRCHNSKCNSTEPLRTRQRYHDGCKPKSKTTAYYMQLRREHGLCYRCLKPVSNGKRYCEYHLRIQSEKMKQNRLVRLSRGLCSVFGCKSEYAKSHTMCELHLNEMKARKCKV